MNKVADIPGQESFAVDVAPQPIEPFHAVSYLNEKEGLIELEDLPGLNLEWGRELTYVEFLGEIGTALAEERPRSGTWDTALGVHGDDFDSLSIENLEQGLYFDAQTAKNREEVVTVGQRGATIQAPGVRSRDEGVAVAGDEFKTIARSARDLARHVHATARKANDKRPPETKLDDETLRDTAGRSVPHALLSKRDELLELDTTLRIERLGLLVANSLAGSERERRMPIGEMDFYRRVSTVAITKAIKVAAAQLGYGTTRREGMNRAVTSAIYRRGNAERAAAVLAYTRWAGYYIDAKRGKISQSLSACEDEFRKRSHFLKTKKPAEIQAA